MLMVGFVGIPKMAVNSDKLSLLQAYFADTVGTSSFEYALCLNACVLAISTGLHRQVAPTQDLSAQEICHRSWLAWGIYCLEKLLVCRSGRPSVSASSSRCYRTSLPMEPIIGTSSKRRYNVVLSETFPI